MPTPVHRAARAAVNDYGKVLVFALVSICTTVLVATNKLTADDARGVFLAMIGYVTGNGVLAVRAKPPSPILAPALVPVGKGTDREDHPQRNGGLPVIAGGPGEKGDKGDKGDQGDPGPIQLRRSSSDDRDAPAGPVRKAQGLTPPFPTGDDDDEGPAPREEVER